MASQRTVPRRVEGTSVVLLKLTDPFAKLARGDHLVGLAGPMDDQLPGSRIATPTGVEAGMRGAMALMMATSRTRHVSNGRGDPEQCLPYALRT